MSNFEDITQGAEEQKLAMINLLVPMPVYKMLHGAATKSGITVANLMTRALQNELKRMETEESQKG